MAKHPYGMGRVLVEDERDQGFLMQSILPSETPNQSYKYWWSSGWWGNQGPTPHCVAFAWAHFLEDGPVTHFYENRDFDPFYMRKGEEQETLFDTQRIYKEAQKVDRWEGEDYDGTSVRAGAKVLRRLGVISEYRWAWDIDTVIHALLTHGPVVVGTWWYNDMFYPDEDGMIEVGGAVVGGHAYMLNGVNVDKGVIRLKNSWGRNWGNDGHAYISVDDMKKLIDSRGEACIADEKKLEE